MKSSIHLNLAIHSSKSVYGFRRDFDYYLNFNCENREIENKNRGNMEMVSLYNDGDDKNES